jgi:broad specificity phosphatase PhoE
VTVFLVRHGKAGSRRDWKAADELRPLSKPGRRQADALADTLTAAIALPGLNRIASSPFVRCRETVTPLAERRGLTVELSDSLAEGTPLVEALRLVEKVADQETVLCSHGDVIGNLLAHFARHGVRLDDDRIEKCSTWALDIEAGAVVAARYLPPPA